jgi:hypothetical protein
LKRRCNAARIWHKTVPMFLELSLTVISKALSCQYWRANHHFLSVTDTWQALNCQPMAPWTGLDSQLVVIWVFHADPPSLILSLQIVLKPEWTQTNGVFSLPAGRCSLSLDSVFWKPIPTSLSVCSAYSVC